MRMTFVLPGRGLFGGVRVVATHANKLIERGHEVTLVCLRRRLPRRPGALLRRAYHEARVAGGLDRDHLHDFKGRLLSARVEDLAKRVPDGDVVVATHWSTAEGVAGLPKCSGAKCYFIQHYEAHTFDAAKVDATWRLPMRKLVVARWLRDLAAEKFGDSTAVVTPNGIDPRQFDAPPRDPHRPPAVGVMYSAAPWKATAVAFEAVRLARREIPEIALVCFGAKEPTEALPMPGQTHFHLRPPQDHIRDIYAGTDVWLCPSETEGFGLPPLEAMGCRCPVVVTRCGGPMDFVEDDGNGHIVDVGDAPAMARYVVAILSDAALWRRLSDAAYATRARFSLERSVDRFEQALLDVHTADTRANTGTLSEREVTSA